MSRRAAGPEQTPLHQREAPAGGHAHAEEEPHGCLSAQQLDAGEETLSLGFAYSLRSGHTGQREKRRE